MKQKIEVFRTSTKRNGAHVYKVLVDGEFAGWLEKLTVLGSKQWMVAQSLKEQLGLRSYMWTTFSAMQEDFSLAGARFGRYTLDE